MSNDNVKTYYFPDGNGSGNQNGLDSNLLWGMMMGNGGFGGFGGGNWLLALLFFALWGNNGWGNGIGGGRGNMDYGFLSNQLNNETGRDLLMQAIQGNANAINQLSSMLNCNAGELRNAIGSINTQICNLGNQVGMSSMQVINAINAGNATLARELCDCCCKTQTAIQESNYLTERGFCNTNQILAKGFSDIGYETQRQTCDLQNTIKDSTQQILAGQAAIEKRELQREIATLQEEKQTYKLGSMIASATNPILQEIESIKCKLPKTEVITTTPDYVPVNRSINIPYAPYCGGFGFGSFGGWNNNCGCNNSLWG
jgi:hypothetical protein